MFVGIDPGMATGGIVLIDENKVVEVASFGGKLKKDAVSPFKGDPQFGLSIKRAEDCVIKINSVLALWNKEYSIHAIGIEGFVDLKSRAKHKDQDGNQLWIKDRWKTPLVIGMLHPYLFDYKVSYQNPSILSGYKDYVSMIKAKTMTDDLIQNWQKIKTPHQMSAWCHADYAKQLFSD